MATDGQPIYDVGKIHIFTNNPRTMPLPSAFLFSVHARFCNPLRWLKVCNQVQLGWPENTVWQKCQTIPRGLVHWTVPFARRLWLCFPGAVRAATYKLLLKVGLMIYGKRLNWVQRVPFGLYIKHGRANFIPEGEAPALKLIEQHTDLLAPKLIDMLITKNHSYLVMTRVPGTPLQDVLYLMSYPERRQFAADLRDYIFKLRKIPNSNTSAICNASGGPVFDYRIQEKSNLAGPFQLEADFNKCLVKRKSLESAVHGRSHSIYFTHADLRPSNVLMNAGKLSGLVDFGCAGFFPEYWEYTKGVRGHFAPDTTWIDLLCESFGGAYREELEAERKIWENTSCF